MATKKTNQPKKSMFNAPCYGKMLVDPRKKKGTTSKGKKK